MTSVQGKTRGVSTQTDSSPWDNVVWTMCSHLRNVPLDDLKARLYARARGDIGGDNLRTLAESLEDGKEAADALDALDAEIKRLREAVQKHHDDVWGESGPVGHDVDADLYEAAGVQAEERDDGSMLGVQ